MARNGLVQAITPYYTLLCHVSEQARVVIVLKENNIALKTRVSLMTALLALWLAPPVTLAQQSDSPGSEDHPMVTRYEGSFIDGYEIQEFDDINH